MISTLKKDSIMEFLGRVLHETKIYQATQAEKGMNYRSDDWEQMERDRGQLDSGSSSLVWEGSWNCHIAERKALALLIVVELIPGVLECFACSLR